jgi:hypothetical protein
MERFLNRQDAKVAKEEDYGFQRIGFAFIGVHSRFDFLRLWAVVRASGMVGFLTANEREWTRMKRFLKR